MNKSDTRKSMEKCSEYLDMVLNSNPDEAEALAIKGILTFFKADALGNRSEKKNLNAEAGYLLSHAFRMNTSLRLKYNLFIMNRKIL